MTHRERIEAVLRGDRPDHPPVSFWHHFSPDEATGEAAVRAHLRLQDAYDLDFMKVMNDHEYPRADVEVVRSTEDLRRLRVQAGDAGELAGQLEVLRTLRARYGEDLLTCTTVFNAWTWLRKMAAPVDRRHGPPNLAGGTDPRDAVLTRLLREDRGAVQAALEVIAETLAAFAGACVEAGAFGIFLSVRDDWVDSPDNGDGTYAELVRAADLRILEAVQEAPFNVLHVCGRPLHFEAFADYPVAVINWADRAGGPSIASVRARVRPAIAGGIDNLRTLPQGRPEDVVSEVRDAIRQAGERPILVTPGCTFDPDAVPEENLRAMVSAARSGASAPG